MKYEPLVAIVILNYNGRHFLQKFLPSVLASTYINKKVIVGDNASTDDSVEWMAGNYPKVEVIQNKGNYGYAKGYNQVLQQVQADYFVTSRDSPYRQITWPRRRLPRERAGTIQHLKKLRTFLLPFGGPIARYLLYLPSSTMHHLCQ